MNMSSKTLVQQNTYFKMKQCNSQCFHEVFAKIVFDTTYCTVAINEPPLFTFFQNHIWHIRQLCPSHFGIPHIAHGWLVKVTPSDMCLLLAKPYWESFATTLPQVWLLYQWVRMDSLSRRGSDHLTFLVCYDLQKKIYSIAITVNIIAGYA